MTPSHATGLSPAVPVALVSRDASCYPDHCTQVMRITPLAIEVGNQKVCHWLRSEVEGNRWLADTRSTTVKMKLGSGCII